MSEGLHTPKPSCSNLQIPSNTSRKQEVLLMSLMYPNNLFNDFIWRHTHLIASPLCRKCKQVQETPYHIILQCSNQANQARKMLEEILSTEEIDQEDYITILNGSRHQKFVKLCLEILSEGTYRDEIILDGTVWFFFKQYMNNGIGFVVTLFNFTFYDMVLTGHIKHTNHFNITIYRWVA